MKKEKMIDENMLEEVGFVASGSKPQNMKFYSQQQINTDCVVIEMKEDGEKIVYEITDVDAYNSRMDDMELIRYILPGEDYTKYNIFRASARPLGMIKNNELFSIRRWFVAPPGKIVKVAQNQEIAMVCGVEQRDGKQRIGRIIRHEQIIVWVDIPRLLTTHMAMVGRSGQGKSNLAKIMLRNLPIKYMVFTKVNEYTNIQNTKVVNLEHVSVDVNTNLLKKIFELSNSEVQYLKDYLKKTDHTEKLYSYELAENIRNFYERVSYEDFQQINLFGNITQVKKIQLPKFVESLCNKIESVSIEITTQKRN